MIAGGLGTRPTPTPHTDWSPMGFYIFATIFALAMVAVIVVLHRIEKARRRGLQVEADRLGLKYSYYDPYSIAMIFSHMNHFSQGINKYAFNVVHGQYKGHLVLDFDFHYALEPQKKRRNQPADSQVLSVMALMLPVHFPALLIRPRVMMDRFPDPGEAFVEVPVDSVAFSSAYVARATDAAFGAAVCHPDMLDYVVKHPGLSVEINGNSMVVHLAEILEPERLESQLNRLLEVYELIPEALFEAARPADPQPLREGPPNH